jgi:hypothetical protein
MHWPREKEQNDELQNGTQKTIDCATRSAQNRVSIQVLQEG